MCLGVYIGDWRGLNVFGVRLSVFGFSVAKVLVYLSRVEYNRGNEFGLVGAVRGDC